MKPLALFLRSLFWTISFYFHKMKHASHKRNPLHQTGLKIQSFTKDQKQENQNQTRKKIQNSQSCQSGWNFILYQKDRLIHFLKNLSSKQGQWTEHLIQKYWMHVLILIFLLLFSIAPKLLPFLSKETPAPPSLDSLVPNGFVLMPIEIRNSQDIQNIIGAYGVVDLYAYSENTGLPEILAASALKVLPPSTEEGSFVALVPEKSAIHLFDYTESFYAVIQNPQKTGVKIYKKEKNKSLIVIEEVF